MLDFCIRKPKLLKQSPTENFFVSDGAGYDIFEGWIENCGCREKKAKSVLGDACSKFVMVQCLSPPVLTFLESNTVRRCRLRWSQFCILRCVVGYSELDFSPDT
ncbi:hypothetical protein CEXT_727581 [Caerostris extrusa]|uniref:Uncharacterized protein n=1 Tax=Caerostris extrusa TaxID=172846 RepID=A0AAV4PPE2_CAEEX|nr:hypothetical protein CEXT_727581 [Caerostris extrusa]